MYRLLTIIVICLTAGCMGTIQDTKSTPEKPYVEIQFSLNKDAYPMLLGFLKTCYPQIAIWVSGSEVSFQKTIYVTDKGAHGSWTLADTRPSATPVWNGIRNKEKQLDIDCISGATPSGELHTVTWQIPPELLCETIQIYIEANVSFDYNDYYSDDENQEGYSGVNGQPSLVWKAELAVNNENSYQTPVLIGHGHVTGADDRIHNNLERITSARQLFHHIKVHYIARPDSCRNQVRD